MLGCGRMGVALSRALSLAGLPVLAGTGRPGKTVPGLDVADHGTVLRQASTVLLAVPYAIGLSILTAPGVTTGGGRVLIDATNSAFGDVPHGNGSNGAALAAALPEWRVVKAFNTVSAAMVGHPVLDGRRVTLPIAGDDAAARAEVANLAARLGFQPVEVGTIARAADLEAVAGLLHSVGVSQGFGGRIGLQVVGLD